MKRNRKHAESENAMEGALLNAARPDVPSPAKTKSSADESAAGISGNHHSALASASLDQLIREMLVRLGEDPEREGLLRTPLRVHRTLEFLTKGYNEDPLTMLNGALFTVEYDEMVIVKDIEMFSLCEHHMLPFFGKVHVAYIPNGKVIGLSKVPRLVEVFARRLKVQERLTTQIAETIQDVIQPLGVGVVIEARHLCMMMRGVEKQHSAAVTSAMLGAFRRSDTRNEFLALIRERQSNGL